MRVIRDSEDSGIISQTVGNIPNILDRISLRASKGTVAEGMPTNIPRGYVSPPYEYKIFIDMMQNDPVLASAIDAVVEVSTKNGYFFHPRQGFNPKPGRLDKAQDFFDNQLNFDEVLNNILYSLTLHNICYLEVVKKPSTAELHVLETTEMAINHDENGEILGYVQTPSKVVWSPDDIVLFRARVIGSRLYPYSSLEPASRAFSNNIRASQYLNDIFLNMPPKLVWILKNATAEQRKLFISNLRVAKTNYDVDMVINAKEGAEVQRTTDKDTFSGLLNVLYYLREQVLVVTRVPDVWLGLSGGDSSNRGDAEAKITAFESKVKWLQGRIESQMNRELLPKLGYNDIQFKFHGISLKDEKVHFQNAQIMRAIGFRPEDVLFFLRDKGIKLPNDAEIEELVEQGAGGEMQDDTAPSRQRMDKKNDSMNTDIGEKGTSDAGGKKLEEKAINMRSPQWVYDALQEGD